MTSADLSAFPRVRLRRRSGADRSLSIAAALFLAVVIVEALLIAAALPIAAEVSLVSTVT